ncbi:phosphate ABC transporter substrate-binding protein [Paroceanicella profunda]|uniref:Phosphate ABC transporter substrate-binding protein n=1 Tax=Paroceanicella profunda TaxID=2579971 RepID=A0A5B8FZ32_9RHOB|nr:substrate-binding domain-containing protein [Paroceanicella profunda]QDL91959.1 phosphate ABC transporter substrate-binding protein [Paroceanicella profunda]
MNTTRILAIAAAATLAAGVASARDQIRIVGSSTVFPFTTAVAEQFGQATGNPIPVVESTGTGGGMKLFCAGVGAEFPDFTNASRRMKASEFTMCQENGVTDIVEMKVGFDGIVIANAMEGPTFTLTVGQIWTALAANGPKPMMWNEVDPALPATKIEVLGPPPSSGTRDSFEELAMEHGCKMAGGEDCGKTGMEIRQDGVYVESGENDNLIVSKLEANPNALGIFGFSYLDQNADRLKGASVDGEQPTFETIADGTYEISRSLYVYVKKAHVGVIPGMEEFLAEYLSPKASGEDGYLVDKGLIPLPEDAHEKQAEAVSALTPIEASALN